MINEVYVFISPIYKQWTGLYKDIDSSIIFLYMVIMGKGNCDFLLTELEYLTTTILHQRENRPPPNCILGRIFSKCRLLKWEKKINSQKRGSNKNS